MFAIFFIYFFLECLFYQKRLLFFELLPLLPILFFFVCLRHFRNTIAILVQICSFFIFFWCVWAFLFHSIFSNGLFLLASVNGLPGHYASAVSAFCSSIQAKHFCVCMCVPVIVCLPLLSPKRFLCSFFHLSAPIIASFFFPP